jgi:hypothetical protein
MLMFFHKIDQRQEDSEKEAVAQVKPCMDGYTCINSMFAA